MPADDDLERRIRNALRGRRLDVPVAPDAIDRIHAGARRRQQRRSAGAVLGAITVIGIAAGAIALRPHDHASTAAANLHSASPSTSALTSSSAPPAVAASPVATPSTLASLAVVAPTGLPIASTPPVQVFNPVSVSAVGANDYWVLGYSTTTTSDGFGVTTTLVRTTDAGQHFTPVASPPAFVAQSPAKLAPGAVTITDVRFGDTKNGWAYGTGLFQTTNGGASWSAISGVPGNVVDLAAASDDVWAVADDEASGSPSYSLLHATYGTGGTGDWTKVSLSTTSFTTVVVIKKTAYVLAATAPTQQGIFITISNGGSTVRSTLGPCGPQESGVLSVGGDGSLWALCTGGHTTTEFVSTDQGAHWTHAAFPLVTYAIGGVDSGHAVVYDDTELDLITLTGSSPVPPADGSVASPAASFIGFTTTKVGFLVASMQSSTPAQLWRTTDGGATWSIVGF